MTPLAGQAAACPRFNAALALPENHALETIRSIVVGCAVSNNANNNLVGGPFWSVKDVHEATVELMLGPWLNAQPNCTLMTESTS